MDRKKELIKRMKAALVQAKMKQSDMAREMNVSRQMVSHWFVNGAISDNRLQDVVDWLATHGVETSVNQLRYGNEAQPGESYLSLVMRTISEASREGGGVLGEQEKTDLVEEFFYAKTSPELIRSIVLRLSQARAEVGRKTRRPKIA